MSRANQHGLSSLAVAVIAVVLFAITMILTAAVPYAGLDALMLVVVIAVSAAAAMLVLVIARARMFSYLWRTGARDACLLGAICPACASPLRGAVLADDGCTVCLHCGAAWRLDAPE